MTEAMESQQPVDASPGRGLNRLLASTGVSIAGQGMVLAAVPLLAARLTSDPFEVSLTVAATYAAWLVVGLPAGALVDRWPRRTTMVISDVGRALVVGALAIAVLTGAVQLWALVACVFLLGIAGCFFDPAAQAALPLVVGRDQQRLATANGRIWSLDLFGRSMVGPPLGAALFALGASIPFFGNAIAFLISAVLLVGLGRMVPPPTVAEHPPVLRSVREGLSFLARHTELRLLTIGMAVFNFVYNVAYSTLVLFARDRLHVTETGFGFLLAASAIGGLAAGYLVPKIRRQLPARGIYGAGLLAQGCGWVLVLVSPNPWVAGLALALVGAASMSVTVLGGTARQRLTPDELLGRVSATTRVAGIGVATLGAMTGGIIAGDRGLSGALIAASALAGLAACLMVIAGGSVVAHDFGGSRRAGTPNDRSG
ncbi:MFS transporter [Terrabacter carboxydivorans]|uniref:Major facilitator superfamily (MFS) profile domain-containing protein n=1 Tax=Terrabacter carboxydivorans TaxID=619730 RepID=A0ABN3MGP3_9MICO